MKKIKHLFILAILVSVAFSCKKQDEPIQETIVENMSQLTVDQDFNWSASMKGELLIKLINPNNVSTDLEIINIVDENDKVIKKARII